MSIFIKSLKSLTMSMMTKAVRSSFASFGEALKYCYKVARGVMGVAHLFSTVSEGIAFVQQLIAVNEGGKVGTVTFLKKSDGVKRVIEFKSIGFLNFTKTISEHFFVSPTDGSEGRSFLYSNMISLVVV